MRSKVSGLLVLLFALTAIPAAGQVVINEILPNPASEFDGAEFIELYNKGASAVSLAGWRLAGTEFAGTCGGEDFWEFPAGASIPGHGYVIVAKDVEDNIPADINDDDGFRQRYGFDPDFEMYDSVFSHDSDDPAVPNMILAGANSAFDDQIGLIPGAGYAASCATIFNQYEALYLYNGSAVLQDAIEYRNPATCTADVCLGVGNSDDDAFVGLPGVGVSLARDASSTDTNSSDVDLALSTPTPYAANINNPGPDLDSLAVTNPDPFPGETTDVTIWAEDLVDGIGPMYVMYTVNGGAVDSVAMSLSGASKYTGSLGPFLEDDLIRYWVRAYDGGSPAGYSKYPDYGTRGLRWGTQSIFDVQFFSPPTDSGFSAEIGNPVNIEGIVTTESGPFNPTGSTTFTVQSAAGFWNGVHVIDFNEETNVQRGDYVRIAGEVGEYFNLTQIEIFSSSQVQIQSSGNALPAAYPAMASELATGGFTGEALEGVYTKLTNVEVTNADDGQGQWLVTDASGTAKIGDLAFYNYNPTVGDSLDSVEGIVTWSWNGVTQGTDERKLEPRGDGDILGPPIIAMARYSPTPPTSADALVLTAEITDNGSITRAKLYYSTDNGATYDSTDMANTGGSSYEATLAAFPNGTEVDYHFETTDNDGFTGRAPVAGNYDLYIGFRTIETIQSSMGAGSDTSIYKGSPTNVAGIVTVAPGTTADNIFCIQNTWTTDPAFRGIWVFSGGSLVGQLALGDSVAICGDVDEYYNNTQIRMHFTDAYTSYGAVGEVPAYELTTADLPTTGPGIPSDSEPWEGVLVLVKNAVVTNASAGFGQYHIDSTDPRENEETLVDDEGRFGGALTFEPLLGDSLSVRGVVEFSFSEFKIQPRANSDILTYTGGDATGVTVGGAGVLGFALHQNTPNPFGLRDTRIAFSVPTTSTASLQVFDVQGRLVRTLLNGSIDAGAHVVDWNGRNDNGRPVTSGVYFYRLQAGDDQATRKMIFMR